MRPSSSARRGAVPDADGWPRILLALRLPVYVVVTVCLGVAAHVAAHGLLPAPGRLVFVCFAVTALVAGLLRPEASALRLALVTGALQAGMHVAFAGGAAGAHGTAAVPTPLMLLGHAVAATVVCWWLRRGEAAVWRAVRRLVPALPNALPAAVPAGTQRVLPAGGTQPALPDRTWSSSLSRRGPPVAHVA